MIKKILANRLIRAILLFSFIVIVSASLISYSEQDQSFNTSSSYEPENMMSYFGSHIADIFMQSVGYFIWIFVLSNLLLSLNIIRNNPKRILLKMLAGISSAALVSVSISIMVPSIGVPAHKYFATNSNIENYFWKFGIGLSIFVTGLILFYYSTGAKMSDIFLGSRLLSSFFKNRASDKDFIKIEPSIRSHTFSDNKKTNRRNNIDSKTTKHKEQIRGLGDSVFALPESELLNNTKETSVVRQSNAALQDMAGDLLSVLSDFGVRGNIVQINQGPVVTLYEFEPAAGTKSSRVIALADDIARSLCALSARIAVIPGRNALGIELPNQTREFFRIRELVESKEYGDHAYQLPIILGKDISGKCTIVDLAKMPHLLVAGTTGSGKSVAINTMILSLLFKHTPEDCRFIMIDPKMLELSVYDGIPHLLAPVVTESGKAVVALKWAVREMENRYKLMSNLGVRNINGYNQRIIDALAKKEELTRTVQTGFDVDTGKPIYESVGIEMKQLPFIVIIVDEMADLMLVAGKDIESSIQRLAQMARAAGIHLIMATQRPSVDVITGVIKANFPSRISFKVTSKIDSRTILGEQGAEQLLGMGDMLYMGNSSRIVRVHGPFVEDAEVEKISNFLKSQASPDYIDAVTTSDEEFDPTSDTYVDADDMSDEGLYKKAVSIVKNDRKSSTSYIQRVLRIGYNRAAILIEKMEKEGILSSPNHSGKREILIDEH